MSEGQIYRQIQPPGQSYGCNRRARDHRQTVLPGLG